MKKQRIQVVAIHGGGSRKPREAYLRELRQEKPDADDFKARAGWKDRLQESLGPSYEVFNPKMPNKESASYEEWRIWFEKLLPFLRKGAILVGHSLGGIFLAKYLSESRLPWKAKAVMLVAAPWNDSSSKDPMGGFRHRKDLSRISGQAEAVALYHSKDDPVVPYGDMAKYERAIPGSVAISFEDRKHIWQGEFPEIVRDIRSLK